MKFTLVIDPGREEEVVMYAAKQSALTSAVEALVTQNTAPNHLSALGEDGEILLLDLEKVECVYVLESKTYAHLSDGRRLRLKAKLYELEEKLPPHYIRINKSAIANEHHIRAFHPTFSGAVDVTFESGFSDYVSRRCFQDIKRRYLK